MNREQFLLDRKAGIGGSDCAAIMNQSQYKSALDVYYEKIESINFDNDNKILKRGRRAEKYILEEYAEHTGEILETDLPMLTDAHYPFLIGHIDAKVKNQNVIIEAKSTRLNASSWKNGIPPAYLMQVAHYAAISDAERVDIAVLFNNWEYGCFTYYRNEELEEQIRQAAIDFWHNHIIPQIPPPPRSTKDALKAYPNSVECKEINVNDTIQLKIGELASISNQMKQLNKREENIKLEIMEYMKDAERLDTSTGHSIIWKQYQQSRLDTNRLKEDHPSLYTEYLKTTEFRPLKLISNTMY